MDKEYQLVFCRTRNVSCPEKAWNAAGWDIYVPGDLHLSDFMENYKIFLDSSVVFNSEYTYLIPIIFQVSDEDGRSYFIKIQLKSNSDGTYKYEIAGGIDTNDRKLVEKAVNNMIIQRFELLPQSKIVIPTGLFLKLPKGIFIKIDNRSGIASKRGLIVGANIVDNDYHGQVFVNMINTGLLPVNIYADEKFVQMVPLFQPNMSKSVEYNDKEKMYQDSVSERGEGCLGSSDGK